ncbi:23S rRNA (guanosine(2251)-2'-O)-methyltransferase RlmB [Tepidibacter thalassicus]|uniref:RNA methyltransferase, TrmH family n=1 Tax=Tepidibacter thalassicus DSM 15285 TaxID=1123350 RepID=A0A1M5RD64_9FIRM|nr:23S rRNA (guanosine(2251)-2'-O)-methyltransferase RlmB [Tepidibacter thalassicus]SHH24292.1 RNA methyltransferase, TrmH family [Tepidibacter thalassicus DSM 15285]
MILEITSKENEKIKYIKSLLKSKKRLQEKKYIIEGYRILNQAIECSADIDYVVFTDEFLNKEEHKKFIDFLMDNGFKLYKTTNKLFKGITDTEKPQGILAVVKYKEYDLDEILNSNSNFFIILDRIQDPGNMGTIIRTADAAGVYGVILLKGCVDVYNPKVIRSTMGSIFNMPIIQANEEIIDDLKEKGFNIVSSYLNTDNYYHSVNYGDKVALVIGNEGNGIKDEIINKSDILVKIPIYGKAESLNAAMASGILMYEIRNKQG